MDIRGLAQGLNVYYIEARIQHRTKAGYEGTETFPSFWTVGGTPEDAIKNAVQILAPYQAPGFQNFSISAVNADFDSDYHMVTHCAYRECVTCGAPDGKHYDTAHEFHHVCIGNICREVTDDGSKAV